MPSYTATGVPGQNLTGSPAAIRNEFKLVQTGIAAVDAAIAAINTQLTSINTQLGTLPSTYLPLTGGVLSGSLAITRTVAGSDGSVTAGANPGANVVLLGTSSTRTPYGVAGASMGGLYTNTTMFFQADFGNAFRWGWPAQSMELYRTAPGGTESANLLLGSLLPNLYLHAVPTVGGKGLRLHYNDLANLAVLDTAKPLQVREPSGATIAEFNPTTLLTFMAGAATQRGDLLGTASGVTYTLFTATEGMWVVLAYIPNALPAFPGYVSFALVGCDGGGCRASINNDVGLSISVSGVAVQASQVTGVAQTIRYRALRIA